MSTFLDHIEKIKKTELKAGRKSDFIFRGQRTDEPLIPGIARLRPKGSPSKIEKLVLQEFERLRPPFTEFEPKDQWDSLALAQHHGLPTRLLDWSYSSLAALWFCVAKPPAPNRHGVVWVFKTETDDFINFPTDETPDSQPRTRIFRPRSISRRIMAQSGLFTCHKRTQDGRYIPLERNKMYKRRLEKITVPAKYFSSIRDQLNASGVNALSIFPDLDGLSKHLQFRYFHE